ncbi:MAG: AmmeMemoRadiSam system protein B [Lentisphaeria bacterium]
MKRLFNHRQQADLPRRSILESTLAGSWYPASAEELRGVIREKLDEIPASEKPGTCRNILILPHAGYAYSLSTAVYGVRELLGQVFKRVLLLAPSHRAWLPNQLAAPEAEAVATPLGEIPLDVAGIREIARHFSVLLSDSIHQQEHAAQIQYPLLQYALSDFRLIPLIVGSLDAAAMERATAAIAPLWDAETLLLISSDFTHYGKDFQYTPFSEQAEQEVRKLDLAAFEWIHKQDRRGFLDYLERTGATICGQYPLALMLAMLDQPAGLTLLHYSNSLADSRKADNFVCYLAASGHCTRAAEKQDSVLLNREDRLQLLLFARSAIGYVFKHRKACPDDYFAAESSENIRQELACFVTLTKRSTGNLRGCIGEITAFRPLYQAVTARAVDAAFRDRRFPQLTEAEFQDLEIEISVLTPAREVSSYQEIMIGKHGMTLSLQGCFAVFLPQVAPEQGWDLETTLTELSGKAGLPGNAWQNPKTKFTVFEAIVFSEDSQA